MGDGPRSQDRIEDEDLERLVDLAFHDLEVFVGRHPKHRTLMRRIMCMALCQGAAKHYIDRGNGVKDLDVWTFFAPDASQPIFPYRRRGVAAWPGPRFLDSTRKVDFLGRTLSECDPANPIATLQGYLAGGGTSSARLLAEKAAVMLWPPELRGRVAWPLVARQIA